MAPRARTPRRAGAAAGAHPRRGGAAGEAGRPAGLCDLLASAGGERDAGRRFPRRACGLRADLRRGAVGGAAAGDPRPDRRAGPDPHARAPRHRRLLPGRAGAQGGMSRDVIFRPARAGRDEAGIAAVHWAARRLAYRDILPRENLDGRTLEVLTREWVEILARDDGAETLVAEAAAAADATSSFE